MGKESEESSHRWHVVLLVLICVCAGLALVYFFAPPKPPEPFAALPVPNAFPELMAAAGSISGTRPDPIRNDPAEIAAYVVANQTVVEAIYAALSKPCVAPPDMMNLAKRRATGARSGLLRDAASFLQQVLQDAEFRGDREAAVRAALGLLELSRVVSPNGTFLDHQFAGVFESIAIRWIAKRRGDLEADQCRMLLQSLQAQADWRPDFDLIKQWDSYYLLWMIRNLDNFRGTGGFDWREFISWHVSHWKNQDATAEYIRPDHDHTVAESGLLRLELGLRLHTLERGSLPPKLGALVPDFLRELPTDPFSTNGFIYRPAGTNWLLYSIGPDRVDDSARPLVPTGLPGVVPKGDIVFTNRVPTLTVPGPL